MKVNVVVLIVVSFLSSCMLGTKVSKSSISKLDQQFQGTFSNNAYKVNGRRYGTTTLLNLFEINNKVADSVFVSFSDSNRLELQFKEGLTLKKEMFQGRLIDEKYFEIYLDNERKEIPPFFPIIFGKYNVNRIRLALTTEGDLIIDNKWNKGGNIFILGVGDKGRKQSYFSHLR